MNKNSFHQKLSRKLREDFPETADYKFWGRFKKEAGPMPWIYRAWAPLFMLAVISLLALAIVNSPEKNRHMLSLDRPSKT